MTGRDEMAAAMAQAEVGEKKPLSVVSNEETKHDVEKKANEGRARRAWSKWFLCR